MNNLALMRNCPGVGMRGRSNKLPGYNFKPVYFMYPFGPKFEPKIIWPLKVCIMKYTLM